MRVESFPSAKCSPWGENGPVPEGEVAGVRILKFGGSSLHDAERIDRVAGLVCAATDLCVPVVVVSAVGHTTDQLEALIGAAVSRYPDLGERREALERRHRELVLQVASAEDQPELLRSLEATFSRLDDILQGVSILQEASARIRDQVLSVGELCSAGIVAAAVRRRGLAARTVDARELIVTDGRHGEGRVDGETTARRVREALPGSGGIPVVTGFISATPAGVTTTLGRGGSDLTATLLGAALHAEEVEIWTDVDGILTADPRSVPDASPLPELGYEELDELARFGARVVHPPAVEPVRTAGIPLRIRSTLTPHRFGTRVVEAPRRDEAQGPVRGVTALRDPVLLRWEGLHRLGLNEVAERLFRALGRSDVVPLLFTVDASARALSLAIPETLLTTVRAAVEAEFRRELHSGLLGPPVVEGNGSLLAIVGEGVRSTPGVAGRLFDALARCGVNVRAIAQGSSGRSVSCMVDRPDLDTALRAVHQTFVGGPNGTRSELLRPGEIGPGVSRSGVAPHGPARHGVARSGVVPVPEGRPAAVRPLRLAVVGTGKVGSVLLDQLRDHGLDALRREGSDPLLLVVARSRRSVVDRGGVDPDEWRGALEEGAESEDGLARAVDALRGVGDGILVDCTASRSAGPGYLELLQEGIGVVSANKMPFSGPISMHAALLEAARDHHAPLRFETTAGAALPWIETVSRLRATGDPILEMDGAFSGTLTSVFDAMNRGVPFSRALSGARDAGLTEPDPREDLRLADVVRKLVILARAAGLPLNADEVTVESLLPRELLEDPDPVAFLTALPELDRAFAARCRDVRKGGGRLVPVARVDASGQAQVGLEEVPADGPLGRLRGTENVLRIRTGRCDAHPLVIQGPGAGPGVTAAGLLSDLLGAAREVRLSR
jgi:bifunctional aspartokinase / homoserine dehydrogenase 1